MGTQTIIETVGLKKIYGMGDATVAALNGVSIQIEPGEFVSIIGPSGSGKSTLMHILGCLSRPTEGKYILDNQDISNLDNRELAAIRNKKIGFVFQAYNLLPRTTAIHNVMLPLMYDRVNDQTSAEKEKLARAMLEKVGLGHRMDHMPQELSGGQQQRVAIARALVNNPVMIIGDEPTGNLDSHSGTDILKLFDEIHSQGATIVIVTHDPQIAAYAHRTIALRDGLVEIDHQQWPREEAMKLTEVVKISWEAISKNKIRSLLTMLGIIIGVAAVIIMISISAGTEATINDQITSLGTNLIFITPSFGRGGPQSFTSNNRGGLVFTDAAAIDQQVIGVAGVTVEQGATETVKGNGVTLTSTSILGSTVDFPAVRSMTIANGSYFTQQAVDLKQNIVVLGSSLATQLFGTTDPIGQYVTIGNVQLAVIGVFKPKGAVGGVDYDARAYLPITVVFAKFTPSQFARFRGDEVRLIYVKVDPKAKLDDVILQIQLLLYKRHNVSSTNPDFSITTQQDIISTQESTTSAFRNLLAWVAGVSLIVGGIGIMNIMLVSVTERTREIGIRQSVGATAEDIRTQFLMEALLLSIFGGIIGLVVGIGGSMLFGALSGMRTVIVPSSVLLAFGSAAIVGIFFGYYPANRAAQLDPIEALRFE